MMWAQFWSIDGAGPFLDPLFASLIQRMSAFFLSRERINETVFKFQGEEYGGVAGSFFWVFTLPGRGARLHKHPYQEVFVLQEGRVTFTIGDSMLEVSASHVVVAPANTPHKFTNTGTEPLQMISFHPSSQVIQEDLE